MDVLTVLPVWAIILLSLLAAGILIVLNFGWLLAAKAMLGGRRHRGSSADDASLPRREGPSRTAPH